MNELRIRSLSFALVVTSAAFAQSYIQHADAFCGLDNGWATVYPPGVIDQFDYQWSNGATTFQIDDLAPGDYSVIVTDQGGGTEEVFVTIGMSTGLPVSGYGMVACGTGSCEGSVYVETASDESAQPITYSIDPPQCTPSDPDHELWPTGAGAFILDLAGGVTYTITATDANGCTGSITKTIDTLGPDVQPGWPVWANTVDQIVPACGGASNGSFQLLSPGDWNNWQLFGANGIQSFSFTDQPYVFAGLAAGTYRVRRNLFWDNTIYLGNCEELEVVIPSLPEPCTGVTGRIIHDADEDCSEGTSDVALSYRVLTIEPGPHYVFSGPDGTYWKNLPEGNYTIEQALVSEVQVCPGNAQEPFAVTALAPLATVDFFNVSTLPHDVSVWLYGPAPQVGSPTWLNIFVTNNSAFYSGDLTLDLAYDPDLLNPSITAPVQLGILPPFGQVMIQFNAEVPPNVDLIDDQLVYAAVVQNTVIEPNVINNTDTLVQTIIGAFDPNDKQGTTSSGISGSQYFLDQDEWLDYVVRFQNTGTAAAQTVVIRDTLDADLSIASIEMLGASHAYTPSFGDERELIFTFNNIDLPDSSADPIGSQGFVGYRIKPIGGIQPGNVIENTAAIYFDFNPPVITNTVAHTVDLSTGLLEAGSPVASALHIWPNPTGDFLNIRSTDPRVRSVAVFDMSGSRSELPISDSCVDVRDLPPGIYAITTGAASARFVKR